MSYKLEGKMSDALIDMVLSRGMDYVVDRHARAEVVRERHDQNSFEYVITIRAELLDMSVVRNARVSDTAVESMSWNGSQRVGTEWGLIRLRSRLEQEAVLLLTHLIHIRMADCIKSGQAHIEAMRAVEEICGA